jgi:type IV pilus assembly protein PilO
MASTAVPKFDLAGLQQKVASQFRGLNPNDPAIVAGVPRWPPAWP